MVFPTFFFFFLKSAPQLLGINNGTKGASLVAWMKKNLPSMQETHLSVSMSYFLQFKSEFGNKKFMIWATVSSQSYFCWLYRSSPSLAAKNIVSLILVLTIWWSILSGLLSNGSQRVRHNWATKQQQQHLGLLNVEEECRIESEWCDKRKIAEDSVCYEDVRRLRAEECRQHLEAWKVKKKKCIFP